jgi:hypothetical protein
VIQLTVQGLKGRGDIGEIQHPSFAFRHRTRDVHGDLKRVAVQSPAFVLRREIRQPVSRFDRKLLEYVHNDVCIFAIRD